MDNTELRRHPKNEDYVVSNNGYIWRKMKGRPRSNNTSRHHLFHEGDWYASLKPSYRGKTRNYLCVEFNGKTCGLHRLVLETFDPHPNSEWLETNHKDRNTFNNHIDNLEWLTTKENIEHRWKTEPPKSYSERKLDWENQWSQFMETSMDYTPETGWRILYDVEEIQKLLKTTTLTKREIANKLGCSHRSVRYWSEKLSNMGMKRPQKTTLGEQVNLLLLENPNITAKDIAEILGKRVTSIHAVLRKRKV